MSENNYDEITFKQLMMIKRIEDISDYDFKGKTKAQARRFISDHIDVLYGGDDNGQLLTEDALRERYDGSGR